jgi:hypothetical protein
MKSRAATPTKLAVSANGRYLVDQAGEPFFYAGETSYPLFKRIYREEAYEFLQVRADQGFNVVQVYLLRGLGTPDIYDETTLLDGDPEKPNPHFFANVDRIVDRANQLGIAMGMVATHGEHVHTDSGSEKVFTIENAFAYGRYLGKRYRDNLVMWYLGGDRRPTAETRPVWASLAQGLKEGSAGAHLVSYHGPGDSAAPSSSYWVHEEPWLDFNTIQSGHGWSVPCYDFIAHDYGLQPTKPTLNMEASYENYADTFTGTRRRITSQQTRMALYWSVLAGACGHTYGCVDTLGFFDPDRTPYLNRDNMYWNLHPTTPWREALHFEGAVSTGVASRLFAMRPWHELVPDQSIIVGGQGLVDNHAQAARAADRSFAIIYLPEGRPISISPEAVASDRVRVSWFDPRNGSWLDGGEHDNVEPAEYLCHLGHGGDDRVLVLDDPRRAFTE